MGSLEINLVYEVINNSYTSVKLKVKPCPLQGKELDFDDLYGSLPTQAIIWIFDSKLHLQAE